jgi:hypothetical protein
MMKQSVAVIFCVIIISSLLTVSLLLQPASPASKNTPTPTASIIFQPTPQSSPERTPPDTPIPKISSTPSNTIVLPTQSSSQPTSQSHAVNRTLQEAIGNATNYLENAEEPYALLLLNIMYRQFGIQEFAGSLQVQPRVNHKSARFANAAAF